MTPDTERIKHTSFQKENFLILHCEETDSEGKGWAGQGKSLEAALAAHHHHFISSQTARV